MSTDFGHNISHVLFSILNAKDNTVDPLAFTTAPPFE